MKFLNQVWGWIKSGAGVLWHVVGGAVTGTIIPTLSQTMINGQLTKASLISTIVSGVIGAIIGAAQHSNNKVVANAANQITPASEATIDAKVTAAVSNAVAKIQVPGVKP